MKKITLMTCVMLSLIAVDKSFSQAATDSAEYYINRLFFNNVAFPGIGDATGLRGSTAADSFYLAAYVVSPGETGVAGTECNYTNYSRVSVYRGNAWTCTADSVVNAATVAFPQCGGGTNIIVAIGVHRTRASTRPIFYTSASLSVSNLITPTFAAGSIVFKTN